VRGALTNSEGVKDVTIDFDNRVASCTIDSKVTSVEQVVQAVKAAGDKFSDTTVKAK